MTILFTVSILGRMWMQSQFSFDVWVLVNQTNPPKSSISENLVSISDLAWQFALEAMEHVYPSTRVCFQTCHVVTCPRRHWLYTSACNTCEILRRPRNKKCILCLNNRDISKSVQFLRKFAFHWMTLFFPLVSWFV